VIFLFSLSTTTTASAVCLDAERNHVIDKEHFLLVDCHSPVKITVQPLIYEYRSALLDQQSNKCIDISITNLNSANRLPESILPVLSKSIYSVVLIDSHLSTQKKVTKQVSSVLNQPEPPSRSIKTQRTVVLLI